MLRLFAPVDIASIVYFRIAFGLLVLVELWRFIANGWVARYFIEPWFHFTYQGFDWVRPWPGVGMHLHFAALMVLAALITVGLLYRLAAALFFVGFVYVFLLEQARYLNHFYLMALVSFLMILVPAHRAFSLDVRRRPSVTSQTAPAWSLWALRGQIAIPYFFGGLAKLNADWLAGEPMRTWLSHRTDYPVLGQLVHSEITVSFFTYGGLALDLLAAPLLLWNRTRPFALVGTFSFHLLNAWLFSIGIFPWFMMAATLLFLPPEWPRSVIRAFRPGTALRSTARPVPVSIGLRQTLLAIFLGLFALVQLLAPFRHYLYPGEVIWTEEGSMFSWQMMLRDKPSRVRFFALSEGLEQAWEMDPYAYVTRWQYDEMDKRPDLILQLSHYIARDLRARGVEDVKIHVRAIAALNGRRSQLLIDPGVDLAAQPRRVWPPASWIMPLTEELRTKNKNEE